MSLKQITVTSVDALLTALQAAALSAGWSKASGNTFKARSSDSHEFTLTKDVYRSKEHIVISTDISTNDKEKSLCGPFPSFFRVWFKIEIKPVPYIVVIIETEQNSLRFLSFGYLQALNGQTPTVPYIAGQGVRTTSTPVLGNLASGFVSDYSSAGYASHPGGVIYNGVFYKSGGYSSGYEKYDLCGGGIPSTRIGALMLCGINAVGSTQLIENPLIWIRPKGGITRKPVGYLPVRAISMQDLVNGQALSLAGTDYRAFSLGSKSSSKSASIDKPTWGAYALNWGFVLEDN